MPSEACGLATFCWDQIDIRVAIVLSGEGNEFSIRGKVWVAFLAFIAGEPARIASVFGNDPQIIGIYKHNVGIADGGLAQQHGALRPRAERNENGTDEKE